MRRLTRAVAAVLAAAAVAPLAVAPPALRAASMIPVGVAFLTTRDGIVVESDGRTTAVLTTSDGARSLVLRRTLRGDAWGVGGGAGVLWLLVGPCPERACVRSRGRLYVSADGGRTWRARGAQTLVAVSLFGRSGVAIVTGARRPIRTTVDGGRHWRAVVDPCRATPVAVTASPLELLCSGGPATDMAFKWLYRSRNGGRSWRLMNHVVVPQRHRAEGTLPLVGIPEGMAILPAGLGWMWFDRFGFASTADGGRRWTVPAYALAHGGQYNAGLMSVINISPVPGSGWTYLLQQAPVGRGEGIVLLRTGDGGGSWHVVRTWPAPG